MSNAPQAIYSRVIGTGSYLPSRILTNADLAKLVDTSDDWIVERTGIRERHIAAEGELTSDLALVAAERALEAADLDAAEIGLIVVATTTPDRVFPSTACALQAKLGMREAMAISIVNAAVILEFKSKERLSEIKNARITLGAVAPTIVSANEAEHFLIGKTLDECVIAEAAHLAMQAARPIDDIRGSAEYRREMVGGLVSRAMSRLR